MSAAEESKQKKAFGIGWEFVKEYYTIMHHEPQSLYKFYGNDSFFCYGFEGESTQYCNGKEEIRKRISDIDYKECRVVVSNVDSQPSNNEGIIVQVLGEMSNKDEQAIKFAQTFFLAVQQGGYYVLNDIFRHLKDEVNEEYEELIQQTEEEKEEEVKTEPLKVEEPPAKQEKPETKKVETKKVETKKAEKPAPAEEAKPAPAKEKKTAAEAVASKPQAQKAAPAKEAAAPAAKEAPVEASKPTAAKVAAAAAEVKPVAATPARPMTYSSIASSSAKSWSKVAAQGDSAKPATVVVKQSATTTTQKHQESRNSGNNSGNNNDKDSHTVFIKLPFSIAKEEISNELNKFGEIKNIEINGTKNYAFVEFATVEQARKAVQNGEFTVNNTKINIEERKRTNKNHGNGRMNSSYSNRSGRSDYNRNYSGGSNRGSNDSNNMGSRRGGSNNGKQRPYKN